MSDQNGSSTNQSLRDLPSVTVLIKQPKLLAAAEEFGQMAVTAAVRETVDILRSDIQSGPRNTIEIPSPDELAGRIAEKLSKRDAQVIRPVINATGILLHTGLGRSPLAAEAAMAAEEAARGYCNVELDLESGQRTQRSQVVEQLLCELTGAEAAHVVNNNAGATGLILATLATGREVIVSHGELIEIGGGFRIPDVIFAYGAVLRTVGTTNRTRADDYTRAIGEETGAMLVVHPSNYHIAGFTEQADLRELAILAKEHQVPLVHDIGSGALIDFEQFGCAGEPVASDSIKAGVDLVLFSGDKLLGGPQCGIIVGSREYVEKVIRHPLSRALRVDKSTLAALHATLKLYRNPEKAMQSVPLLRFLSTPIEKLRTRTQTFAERLSAKLDGWDVGCESDQAFVGGGSLPQQGIDSVSLVLVSKDNCVEPLARALRIGDTPVVGRVQQGRLILSLHGVFEEQDEKLFEAIVSAAGAV